MHAVRCGGDSVAHNDTQKCGFSSYCGKTPRTDACARCGSVHVTGGVGERARVRAVASPEDGAGVGRGTQRLDPGPAPPFRGLPGKTH